MRRVLILSLREGEKWRKADTFHNLHYGSYLGCPELRFINKLLCGIQVKTHSMVFAVASTSK